MRFDLLGGVLALAGSVAAFSDSSPFLLLSTSTLDNVFELNNIQTSSSVLKFTKDVLAGCPTDHYLIVEQPGVTAADLRSSSTGCAMPHLCKVAKDSRIKRKISVSEVVGSIDAQDLTEYINLACEGKSDVHVKKLSLASVSADGKAESLAQNDQALERALKSPLGSESYSILFVATPAEPIYEAEFDEPVRMDLKRSVQGQVRKAGNETEWSRLPLFEKYQFFTPGIFMAIVTAIVLLSILYVGLAALSSLEVSYGAFEKEMGPAQHKKQQ